MSTLSISDKLLAEIERFLKKNKKADLVTTYLFYVGLRDHISPVLYLKEKKIYKDEEEILSSLDAQGKLWRDTEINIQIGEPTINEETSRIYVCPVTGKAFGNNTHPNPQDAIYDWVCRHGEIVDGMRSKRFYVSEDHEIIKSYMTPGREPIKKRVFSSLVTGKLFSSKKAVIEDFKATQLKDVPLESIPSQNRFEIEGSLLELVQEELSEKHLSAFVEKLLEIGDLAPYARSWLEEELEESEEEESV